jgi:N-acetylglucosaminyl-diphospho-decaprenol L-rhamnosyltransferase
MRHLQADNSIIVPPGNPGLSVLIVNWNGGDSILRCLDSVREAAVDLDTEIVVVDNGSTDSSVERIRANAPAARVIENHCNLGFGQAVQVGLAHAGMEYLAVVNPDVVLGPRSLRQLVALLELHPAAAWAGPKVVTTDGVLQSGPFRLFSKWQPLRYISGLAPLLVCLSRLRRRQPSPASVDAPVRCERLSGACMVFRHKALAEIGGMPTTTFMYGEEQLLGARFKDLGYEVWYDPCSSVIHEDGLTARQAWSDQERLLRVRVGLLAAMRDTLSRRDFFIHNCLFVAATLFQSLIGLTGCRRGYAPSVARRFLRASLVAFARNPTI